jgi:hypothetical protein
MRERLLDNNYLTVDLENKVLIGTIKIESVDLTIAQKITDFRLNIQNGKSYPLLSNIKAIKNSTKAARDYMASEEGCKGVIAAAVLIDSPIGSMIGNFFISISRPIRPTKVFTDESEAIKWLSKYVANS